MRTVQRRLVAVGLALAASIVLVFGVFAPPEECSAPSPEQLERSATAAVDWFVRNQDDDGRWLYEYDAEADNAVSDYNEIRHMGVQMSLYQAASAGVPGALESADRGLVWSLDRINDLPQSRAVTYRGQTAVGTTALLVAGLAERRQVTGDDQYDNELRQLGAFLRDQVEPSTGAVLAYYDDATGQPSHGVYSTYYTGEAYWALARLHEIFPDDFDDWGDVSSDIGSYMATVRDDREDLWPPLPDHWAAYGLSVTATFDDRPDNRPLSSDELAYARQQAGLFGSQVRWISQQAGPWGPAVRGTHELRGGGYGVIGEALTGLWRTAHADERLADLRAPLASRAVCNATLSIDHQLDEDDAAAFADPARVEGAWLIDGVTRMDDQQHALSAILATMPIVSQAEHELEASLAPDASSAWVWVVALVAAANPFRVVGSLRRSSRSPAGWVQLATLGGLAGMAIAFVVAAVSRPLLDAMNVSDPSIHIAAGAVAAVIGLGALFRRPPSFEPALPGNAAAWMPVAVPFVAGAGVLTLGAGSAADHGLQPVLVAGAIVVALCAALAFTVGRWPDDSGDADGSDSGRAIDRVLLWAGRLTSAVLLGAATQLIIDGVFSV